MSDACCSLVRCAVQFRYSSTCCSLVGIVNFDLLRSVGGTMALSAAPIAPDECEFREQRRRKRTNSSEEARPGSPKNRACRCVRKIPWEHAQQWSKCGKSLPLWGLLNWTRIPQPEMGQTQSSTPATAESRTRRGRKSTFHQPYHFGQTTDVSGGGEERSRRVTSKY